VCYYTYEGPNHVAPLSSVQLDVFFLCPFLLSVKLLDLYYSISRVLLRPLGGVIFITVVYFYLLCFTLCPFVTKRESNFYLDREFFCPRWPKGEFVSIIGLILCFEKITCL
jgi:hypothetical protein